MSKPTLYLETSVPSYLVARPSKDVIVMGHQQTTWDWWEKRRKAYDIFVSELVIREASRGDDAAATRRLNVISAFPSLEITGQSIQLANAYLLEIPMAPQAEADALHLALASVNNVDYLVTWNCRHIARGSVKRVLPVVNARYGFGVPTICTPEELLYEDADDMD